MSWTEKKSEDNVIQQTVSQRTAELAQARDEVLPLATAEIAAGDKSIDPIDFQPVRSPGNYDAEFALKGDDLIFHFWPSGFHEAQRNNHTPPRFKRGFTFHLVRVMSDTFGAKRIEIEPDEDMGAVFVKALGQSSNQFYRKLAIEACEKLHKNLDSES